MVHIIEATDTKALNCVKDWAETDPSIRNKLFYIQGFNHQQQLVKVAGPIKYGTLVDRCRWISTPEARLKQYYNNHDSRSQSKCKGWASHDIRTLLIWVTTESQGRERYAIESRLCEKSIWGESVPQTPQASLLNKLGFSWKKYVAEQNRFVRYQEVLNDYTA